MNRRRGIATIPIRDGAHGRQAWKVNAGLSAVEPRQLDWKADCVGAGILPHLPHSTAQSKLDPDSRAVRSRSSSAVGKSITRRTPPLCSFEPRDQLNRISKGIFHAPAGTGHFGKQREIFPLTNAYRGRKKADAEENACWSVF